MSDTTPEERLLRLQQRFDAIRATIAELHGANVAYAAASCAWLMTIDNCIRKDMRDVAADPTRLEEFIKEHSGMLQGFHQDLCDYLEVPHERALDLMGNFKQVMRDILERKG